MIDIEVPYSPGWWLSSLGRELHDRRVGRTGGKVWNRSGSKPQRVRPGIELLQDHLDGDPPLLSAAAGWADHFREVVRLGRLNVAALIVESKSNRLKLRDFRTASADDDLGDNLARDIMRANDLRVRAREVHDGVLSLGDAYVILTPPAKGETYTHITAEDARQVITAHDPVTGRTLAGLKMFRDDYDSTDFAYLFVREDDGSVRQYVASKSKGGSSFSLAPFRVGASWEWTETFGVKVPGDRMPIVRFRNYRGKGEYEAHLNTLDRVNDKIVNEMVIAKVQAFRQRAVKGLPDTRKELVDGRMVDVPIDYTDVFEAAPGSLWQVPATVDFWESEAIDLGPMRMSIKDELEHLAAVTSTPLHTITPDAASGSAEGASLMRETSVDAAENRRDHLDRPWAEVMATAFAFQGDLERADQTQIEAIWGPAERFSLAERASAASQAVTTLPREAIMRDIWQYAPAEIAVLRSMMGREKLYVAGAPTPAPAPAPLPPAPGPADFDLDVDGLGNPAAG